MLQELSAIFALLRQSITFSKNFFFHLLLLNGVIYTPVIETLRVFQPLRKKILNFIRPSSNYDFGCHNLKRIKLIKRLRLGLSHLRKSKFKRSFQDAINLLCNCVNILSPLLNFSSHSSQHYT